MSANAKTNQIFNYSTDGNNLYINASDNSSYDLPKDIDKAFTELISSYSGDITKSRTRISFLDGFADNNNRALEIKLFTFNSNSNTFTTGNIAGVFTITDRKRSVFFKIRSRFDPDENMFFTRHMLSLVFGINLLNLDAGISQTSGYLYIFLLKPYLKKALSQGIYRSYQFFDHNDSKPKGVINIAEHIKHNIPFNGKIAYRVQEYTTDQSIILLVRATIELINRDFPEIMSLFRRDLDFNSCVNYIYDNSAEFYNFSLQRIIELNSHPVSNSFFSEYEELRILCINILLENKASFSNFDNCKIHGVIFDLSWLWEEYLYSIISKDEKFSQLKHPDNRKQTHGYRPVEGLKNYWYPDFYQTKSEQNNMPGIVMDAKYKDLLKGSDLKIPDSDLHQIFSYMYTLDIHNGILLFPYKNNDTDAVKEGPFTIKGKGNICVLGLSVLSSNHSENILDENSFKENIKRAEDSFLNQLKDE